MTIKATDIEFSGENPEIKGKFGDTIENTEEGVWDLAGAEIINVALTYGGQLDDSDNVVFVNSGFTESAPYYDDIQAAIDDISSGTETNRNVILVLGGSYDGFRIDSLNYISIIGIGDVFITGLSAQDRAMEVIDSVGVKIKNLKIKL